jgi:hypothetical protein
VHCQRKLTADWGPLDFLSSEQLHKRRVAAYAHSLVGL